MEFAPQKYPLQRNLLMLPLFKIPIDATLAYDDGRFWTQIVSEKGTKGNQNDLMSF